MHVLWSEFARNGLGKYAPRGLARGEDGKLRPAAQRLERVVQLRYVGRIAHTAASVWQRGGLRGQRLVVPHGHRDRIAAARRASEIGHPVSRSTNLRALSGNLVVTISILDLAVCSDQAIDEHDRPAHELDLPSLVQCIRWFGIRAPADRTRTALMPQRRVASLVVIGIPQAEQGLGMCAPFPRFLEHIQQISIFRCRPDQVVGT